MKKVKRLNSVSVLEETALKVLELKKELRRRGFKEFNSGMVLEEALKHSQVDVFKLLLESLTPKEYLVKEVLKQGQGEKLFSLLKKDNFSFQGILEAPRTSSLKAKELTEPATHKSKISPQSFQKEPSVDELENREDPRGFEKQEG